MRDSDRLRVGLGARDTLGRVSLRLFELVEECGVREDGAMRIDMPLTQDDLAGWVAASREAVARALASFRKRGIITTARREIRVLDVDLLREAAKARWCVDDPTLRRRCRSCSSAIRSPSPSSLRISSVCSPSAGDPPLSFAVVAPNWAG